MANLDTELKDFPGSIYVGLYRVRISKKVNGKETLPCGIHRNRTWLRSRLQRPRLAQQRYVSAKKSNMLGVLWDVWFVPILTSWPW